MSWYKNAKPDLRNNLIEGQFKCRIVKACWDDRLAGNTSRLYIGESMQNENWYHMLFAYVLRYWCKGFLLVVAKKPCLKMIRGLTKVAIWTFFGKGVVRIGLTYYHRCKPHIWNVYIWRSTGIRLKIDNSAKYILKISYHTPVFSRVENMSVAWARCWMNRPRINLITLCILLDKLCRNPKRLCRFIDHF